MIMLCFRVLKCVVLIMYTNDTKTTFINQILVIEHKYSRILKHVNNTVQIKVHDSFKILKKIHQSQ